MDCLNQAIERCEVSGVPLCAGCLWYTSDGKRISERVAKNLQGSGSTILSPQIYLSALGPAAPMPSLPQHNFINTRAPNGNDTVAALAAVTGLLSIATCFGVGLAMCAVPLPLLPLFLGGFGLVGSKNAAKPQQARFLSWIGVAGGMGFVAVMALLAITATVFGLNIMMPWSMFSTPLISP